MSEQREPFLERWSRLKTKEREVAQEPPAPAAPAAPATKPEEVAPLPRIKDLTPDSDFKPFMNANVDPSTRRDALKKLFADAHFNVPDPYEVGMEDYTGEPIPPELLKTLNQAKKLLFDESEKAAEVAQESVQPTTHNETEAPAGGAKDAAGSKDT